MSLNSQISDTSSTDRIINARSTSRSKKLYAYLGGISIVFIVGVFVYPKYQNWRDTETSYERDRLYTASVTRGVFEQSISVDGTIVAIVKPTLYAPAQGIVSLNVKPGDFVEKDMVVAKAFSPELEAEVEQAKRKVETEKIEAKRQLLAARQDRAAMDQAVETAKIRSDAAQRKALTYEKLVTVATVSRLEYETVKDEALVTASEYEKVKLNRNFMAERLLFEAEAINLHVKTYESILKDLVRQLDDMFIKSPIKGQVGTVSVEERDSVIKNQAIMTIVDLTASGVELQIPEIYAGALQIGLPTEIAYKGRTYKGELASLSPEVVSNKFEARVKFIEVPDVDLKQRQRVSVKIIVSTKDDALKIQRGPFVDSGGGRIAYRVNGDIAEAVPITLGAIGSSEVEVLEGLKAGDEIIISNTDVFNNASKVLLR